MGANGWRRPPPGDDDLDPRSGRLHNTQQAALAPDIVARLPWNVICRFPATVGSGEASIEQRNPWQLATQWGEADTGELRPPVVQFRAPFDEHLGVTTATDQVTPVMNMVART